jgi:hypothetical protein
MTDYPKALYKGAHYLDWMAFCRDLEMRKVEQIIVADADMEKAWREQGFVDAAALMEPEEKAEPQTEAAGEKSWKNMNAEERKAYQESKAKSVERK